MSAQTGNGKPLRFFALVLSCWILGRVALPHQQHPAPDAHLFETAASVEAVAGSPTTALRRAAARPGISAASHVAIVGKPPVLSTWPVKALVAPALPNIAGAPTRPPDVTHSIGAVSRSAPPKGAELAESRMVGSTMSPMPPTFPDRPFADRWRATGWLLWRPDNGSASAVAALGQLGASQAGVRMEVDLAPAAPPRLSTYARFTRALVQPAQPEAALGVSIQPSRATPITVAIERRIGLGDGGRNAMALTLAGGFGPSPVLPGLLGEGYAQAGIVGMRSGDRFVDGRFSLLKPLAGTPLQAGATLSGGAQPQVHRMDVGPAVHARLPSPLTARLMLEWRQRIAGRAYPRSGIALTLAADF